MDQLRTALAWLKKFHFWVLCVLVSLIAVGCWWKASAKMQSTYKASESTITGQFTAVKGLLSDPFHANADVNEKQAAETKKQADGVAKLWQQLYDRQREEVLKWPVEPHGPLSKEFGAEVEKLQFGAEIKPTLRNNYQNYVLNHFKELPKAVDARPLTAIAAGGPGGGRGIGPEGGAMPGAPEGFQDDNDYICQWADADQTVIRDKLYFRDQPSSLKIWVTQEDLWVYHTLLRVIAKTNRAAGATRMSNAAVQVIAELAVGQRAAQSNRTNNRLAVPPPTAAPTGGPGGPEGGPGAAPAAGPEGGQRPTMYGPEGGGGGTGQGLTEEQERGFLLSGRYVDALGKPIPFPFGGGGAAPPGEAPAPPAETAPVGSSAPLDLTVFGQEYKRIPVRMLLRMDQRFLQRLISECASEPLQVEVQEVRVNVADAGGNGSGPNGGIRSFEGGGGASSLSSLFPDESGPQPFPSHPELVNVIIQGTIYIFNKPNPTILQSDQPPATQSAG